MIKRTLQEIADFFDMALAMDEDGQTYMHKVVPYLRDFEWLNDMEVFEMPYCLAVEYSGDWRDSLALPESWTKEPPFKEGELIVSIVFGLKCISYWRSPACNKDLWRRPTEEEWKRLRGEE